MKCPICKGEATLSCRFTMIVAAVILMMLGRLLTDGLWLLAAKRLR